ncbi:MAG: nicotinamide riboside transporter PnuC [Bacteroidota bacterium]
MTAYLDTFRNFLDTPLGRTPWSGKVITFEYTLQILTTCIAFLVVILTIQRKGYAWMLNILKKLFGMVIYLTQGLYAKIILDCVLIMKSSYGLYKWGFRSKKSSSQKEITILTKDSLLMFFLIALTGWVLSGSLLYILYQTYPALKGKSPFIDGFHASFAVVNYYLLAQKKRESWLFSFAAHISYAYLFIMGAKPFAIKYIGYLCLSLRGLDQWDKNYKKNAGKSA